MDTDHHRGQAVLSAAGLGHQTLGHLSLHHHDEPLDLGGAAQCIEQQRCPDVVRKIGDHDPAPISQILGEVDIGDVEKAKLDREPGRHLGEHGKEPAVDLIGNNAGTRGGQRPGQGAGACSDLHHLLPRPDSCHLHDLPGDVGVGQEMLAQPS